jgi:hypothetical protein
VETIQGYSPLSEGIATEAPLLASLITYFKDPKPENVMTLALFHVLQKHPCLQRDLVDWIFKKVSHDPPANIRMTTQERMTSDSGPDGEGLWVQPDICFLDDNAGTVLMIENKFLAELQSTQPVAYIKRLSTKRPAGLVLIAPQSQLHHYQSKCRERIQAHFPDARRDGHRVFIEQKFFYLLSWEDLIEHLLGKIPQCGDLAERDVAKYDVAQLEGIRRKMEGEKLDPFEAEEFDALKKIAGRIPKLYGILERLRFQLRPAGKWSTATLEKTNTIHGLNLRIRGLLFWLVPDFNLLAKTGPRDNHNLALFWLRIGFDDAWGEPNKSAPGEVQERIYQAMSGVPSQPVVRDEAHGPFLMQFPFHVDQSEEELIRAWVDTIETLDRNLGELHS